MIWVQVRQHGADVDSYKINHEGWVDVIIISR